MLPNINTCENGWSNLSENLRIVQFRVVEITRFLSPKSINLQLFTLILYGVGVRCDVDIFKLTASAQSIYREVNEVKYMRMEINVIYIKVPCN